MMTYLKHVRGKKQADLKNKNFKEIQVLYKKVKRSDKDFIAIGSAKDERQIKEMNEESKDPKKKRVVNETPREEDTAKVPAEQEVTEQGTKKRKSGHKMLRIVTLESTIDSEIMETKSFVSKLHKVSSPDGDYLVVYRVNGHFRAFNYLMEVLHIFDRQDLFHLYDLVMKQYSEITPEGIELILWGDLKIMMESSAEENDQELKDGTVIHMLVERRYPLSKELFQRCLIGFGGWKRKVLCTHLIESHKSSTKHPTVYEFVIINIPEEDVEPQPNLPLQEIIILDPDDQPMWESAKTVAPTPNSAIVKPNVDDNFVINSTHLNMIRESKFDGYLWADPHDHIREFLVICDMFRYGKTQSEAVNLLIFPFPCAIKLKHGLTNLMKSL
ncbi:hypothetical protein Tco_0039906 [Tanacetum coccineum]